MLFRSTKDRRTSISTYRVLDSDRRDMTGWVPPYAKGGLTEGFVDLARAGEYFIEVRDGSNDGRSILPAVLTTRFTPTTLSYEPNDTFGTATQVPLDRFEPPTTFCRRATATGRCFMCPAPARSMFWSTKCRKLSTSPSASSTARQRDLTGWIGPPRPGGETTGSLKLEKPGWYWMEIRDSANDARSPRPFRITRTFTPGG